MDVTGVVQVQCRHVLVKSTVDLQLGERYVLVNLFNASKLIDKQLYKCGLRLGNLDAPEQS